jgi:CBS domain containing-hemolysin-like protein
MSEAPRTNGDTRASAPKLIQRLTNWLRPDTEAETVRDVIEELIEERIEERPEDGDLIDSHERLLLGNVLRLRDVGASDIMVPRADIVAIEVDTTAHDVLRFMVKEGHSRVPVYRQTLDDVVGIVHIKDLAVLITDQMPDGSSVPPPPSFKLTDVVRQVLFVSPAVRVLDLLLEMRLKRTHMAMVVDEYGGIDGLVTIEDVVEQIVGEIEDEHDTDSAPRMSQRDDGTVIADARVTLEEFESHYGKVFSEDEREATDTLGGLVIRIAGRVPARSELVKHPSGLEFEVTDSDPRRVRRLRVRNLPQPPEDG